MALTTLIARLLSSSGPANAVGVFGPATGMLTAAVRPVSAGRFVFWWGVVGHVCETWYDGRWHARADMHWQTASGPGVAAGNGNHQYLFWRGSNGHVTACD